MDDEYIQLGLGKLIFLARYSPEQLPFDLLEQVIECSVEDATQSLCSGSLAVALLIRDLCALELLDPSELEDLADSADVIFRNAIGDHALKREYDLFTGLVGKGVYFLAARQWDDAATIVRHLDAIKIEVGNSCYWLDLVQGADKCDLGLAHGMPSIIAFLAECFRCEVEPSLCCRLLKQVIPYVLTQQGRAKSPFEFTTGLNVVTGEAPATSRLAWCYGDLGVGIALWRAGHALNHEPWRESALAIMRNAAQIRGRDKAVDGLRGGQGSLLIGGKKEQLVPQHGAA